MTNKREDFQTFLLCAHKAAYGQGDDEPGTSPGWIRRRYKDNGRQMLTKRQAFSLASKPYRIVYMELVFSNMDDNPNPEEAIWQMMYNGQILENAEELGDSDVLQRYKLIQAVDLFLIATLIANDDPTQMRGPAAYEDGDWVYICEQKGDHLRFDGKETVLYKDAPIYQGTFKGQLRA